MEVLSNHLNIHGYHANDIQCKVILNTHIEIISCWWYKVNLHFFSFDKFFLSYNETQISWQAEISYKNICKDWLCNIDDEGRINFVVVF